MLVNVIHPRVGHCLLATTILSAMLCACSSPGQSSPLEPSKLELRIVASDRVNLDEKGRAAPVLVRLYELKREGAFQDADFFTLDKQDTLTLGTDLLVKEEFIFRPGESLTIERNSHPDTTAIGVLAAYRQLDAATWRVVYRLKPAPQAAWYRAVLPANKAKLNIELQAKDIKLNELE